MTKIRPLTIEDQALITTHLRKYPPEVSELTFTNLYVWRRYRPIFFAEIQASLVFLTSAREGGSQRFLAFGPPVGPISPASIPGCVDIELTGFVRIPAQTATVLREAGLPVEPDRDNSDYVYRVSDLAEIGGRQFHKKRNLIKQCLSAHQCQYEPVTPALLSECLALQDRWCQERQCELEPSLCGEYEAIRETLSHYHALRLFGGAIRVDGTIQAFAIAEELQPGTAVCHFEKALPGILGLSQLINQWFARHALQGFEFVNREQDLGLPGLRQAKESYYPHHRVEKFVARIVAAGIDHPTPAEPHACDQHAPYFPED